MNHKLKTLGATLLLASVFALGVKSFTPAAYANPNPAVAAVVAQLPDNKAPWPNTTAATQFGSFYDFEDVYDFVTTVNWVDTETGAGGTVVNSLGTAVKGGALVITTDTSDDNREEIDNKMEIFDLDAGDTLVFTTNLTTGSDVTQVDLGAGIGITDTDWLGDSAIMSDGIFFEKNDGDAYLDLVFAKDAASTSDYTRIARVYDLAASTTYKLCFVVTLNASDSTKARYRVYVNDVQVASGSVSADVPDDEGLCLKVGVQNGEAAAKTLTVNSIGAAQSY